MTFDRSRRDDFTSSSWAWRNSWRSCSASYSSRASGLIGPIKRSSRSSSRALAVGVTPSLISGGSVEIGRASCRERVCQYVSLSVVAVSLQQKKKTHTVVQKHTAHITKQ